MKAPHVSSTVVSSIPIAEVEKQKEMYQAYFNEQEKSDLNKRHIRSSAGWIAAKHAICKLLGQQNIEISAAKEIELSREKNGRPVIRHLKSSRHDVHDLKENIFISISHTKTTAYGMAVYQANSNENQQIFSE